MVSVVQKCSRLTFGRMEFSIAIVKRTECENRRIAIHVTGNSKHMSMMQSTGAGVRTFVSETPY